VLGVNVYLIGKVNGKKWALAEKVKTGLKEVHFWASDGDGHSEHGLEFCNYYLEACKDMQETIERVFCEKAANSDLAIAYIDTIDSFGSIAEIGYLSAIGINIHVIFSKDIETEDPPPHNRAYDTYWFCCSLPNVYVHFSSTINEAAGIVFKILGKPNYQEYLQSEHWAKVKSDALSRANHKCQLCGKNSVPVHVHHNNYKNLYKETSADVIALCSECHSKFHDKSGSR
jgi:nucleoside 2-deoxyribosyltransferase